jgi:hypothetical protein
MRHTQLTALGLVVPHLPGGVFVWTDIDYAAIEMRILSTIKVAGVRSSMTFSRLHADLEARGLTATGRYKTNP